jgi:exonuclease SbcC
MIQSLTLANIQNHTSTKLHFSPGVNYITGPSDNGKTTVVRAIRWVAFNRPAGDVLIQTGSEGGSVIIQLDRRCRIVREKNKKVNGYRINRETYKAIALNVPEEISKALNMNDINIQGQFDNFFLLQDTPGSVSQKFNAIVGLDLIDVVLKKAGANVTRHQQDSIRHQEALAMATNSHTQYQHIDSINAIITRLEVCHKTIRQYSEKIQKLKEFQLLFEELQNKINRLKNDIAALPRLCAIRDMLHQAEELREKKEQMAVVWGAYTRNAKSLEDTRSWLGITDGVPRLLVIIEKRSELAKKTEALRAWGRDWEALQSLKSAQAKALQSSLKRLTDIKKETGLCPLCNQRWSL